MKAFSFLWVFALFSLVGCQGASDLFRGNATLTQVQSADNCAASTLNFLNTQGFQSALGTIGSARFSPSEIAFGDVTLSGINAQLGNPLQFSASLVQDPSNGAFYSASAIPVDQALGSCLVREVITTSLSTDGLDFTLDVSKAITFSDGSGACGVSATDACVLSISYSGTSDGSLVPTT